MSLCKAIVLWCSLNSATRKANLSCISLNGQIIKKGDTLKYLDVTLDRSLQFKYHVNITIIKCKHRLVAFKIIVTIISSRDYCFCSSTILFSHSLITYTRCFDFTRRQRKTVRTQLEKNMAGEAWRFRLTNIMAYSSYALSYSRWLATPWMPS